MSNPEDISGDLDGRILVKPGSFYTYTYKTNVTSTPNQVNWTVTGDIKIISGTLLLFFF